MRRAYRGTMCSENWRCFRGSINYVTTEDRARGKMGAGGKEGAENGCTTCLYDCARAACMYPVIEINRARSSRHTVPRSHWHREPSWSSIGCPCDFRLDRHWFADCVKRKAIRIRICNERHTVCRDYSRSIQTLCETLIKLFN